MDFRERIRLPDWPVMRQRALAYHGRRCAVCGRTWRLQVHHLTYERLGHERMEDFRILCFKCHKKGRYTAWEIARDRKSLLWLRRINRLTRAIGRALRWCLRRLGRLILWVIRRAARSVGRRLRRRRREPGAE